jgi:ketosteroid isomerase-like protein
MGSRADRFDSVADSGLTSGTRMVRHSISSCRIVIAVLALGVATCAVSAATTPHQKPKKSVSRQAVEALEEQWRQAQLAGDAVAMDRLLSDDFVGINSTGVVTTKTQQLARIKNRVAVITQLDLSDIKVKLIGSVVAVVTSRAEVAGTNEAGPIKGAFRYTRVYQRLPSGAWKITSFEATRLPADGSPRARAEAETPQPPRPDKK